MTNPINRGDQSTLPCSQQSTLPDELGKYVAWDANLVARLRWDNFSRQDKGGSTLPIWRRSTTQPAAFFGSTGTGGGVGGDTCKEGVYVRGAATVIGTWAASIYDVSHPFSDRGFYLVVGKGE